MDLHTRLSQWLSDDRLLANLIGVHVVLAGLLILSIVIRKLLIHGGGQLVRWTGLHWLDGVSKEAVRRMRSLLFWTTLAAMALTLVAGAVYHVSGRDVRADLNDWYSHLTASQLLRLGVAAAELVLLAIATVFLLRLVRRTSAALEQYALDRLPHPVRPEKESPATPSTPAILSATTAGGINYSFVPELSRTAAGSAAPPEAANKAVDHEHTVKRWFFLLERFVLCTVFLGATSIAGHILGVSDVTDAVVGFLVRLLAILMVARLLTLAVRTLSHALAALGDRHLSEGKFKRYWERVTRLFPFGERCFEAAVYISAASLCVHELEFIAVIADFGPRLVQCIGIFFVTRVLIELFSVLLNEAFGMYEEERPLDQKGQTLMPLLQSVGQYTLYFGSGVIMLGVLGVDTRPILAGAGILGLAGGLGAQSLVTDVVSGFFILFENQYLVGDIVKIGDAEGRVEAVSIRHTQIRDDQGKLHIIPNGQIKSVINYSKGYVNAIIDFKAPNTTAVEEVIRDLTEAGRRLRQTRREVLGDTIVKGVVELTPSDMTIRAVTRVSPGAHQAMQNEFRRLLKQVLDEKRDRALTAA